MKPRRWFRFSLRTMFVLLTLSCLTFGWTLMQLQWIRERDRALNELGKSDIWGIKEPPPGENMLVHIKRWTSEVQSITQQMREDDSLSPLHVPWALRLFQARTVSVIGLHGHSDDPDLRAKATALRRLFPEAHLRVYQAKAHNSRVKQP